MDRNKLLSILQGIAFACILLLIPAMLNGEGDTEVLTLQTIRVFGTAIVLMLGVIVFQLFKK